MFAIFSILFIVMLTARVCRMLSGTTLRLCNCFAQLPIDAQRAIWACRAIKEIRTAKKETSYFVNGTKMLTPSLADTIKGLTL